MNFEESHHNLNQSSQRKLFLGNISQSIDEEDLRSVFSKYGKILNVHMPKSNKIQNQHKGYGFIEFDDPEAAAAALEMNLKELKGRQIRVQFSNAHSNSSSLKNSSNSESHSAFDSKSEMRRYNNFNDTFINNDSIQDFSVNSNQSYYNSGDFDSPVHTDIHSTTYQTNPFSPDMSPENFIIGQSIPYPMSILNQNSVSQTSASNLVIRPTTSTTRNRANDFDIAMQRIESMAYDNDIPIEVVHSKFTQLIQWAQRKRENILRSIDSH